MYVNVEWLIEQHLRLTFCKQMNGCGKHGLGKHGYGHNVCMHTYTCYCCCCCCMTVMFVCVHACLYACLSACQSVCNLLAHFLLHIDTYICLSCHVCSVFLSCVSVCQVWLVCQYAWLSIYLCLSVCKSVCPSACLSVGKSVPVCLSACLSVADWALFDQVVVSPKVLSIMDLLLSPMRRKESALDLLLSPGRGRGMQCVCVMCLCLYCMCIVVHVVDVHGIRGRGLQWVCPCLSVFPQAEGTMPREGNLSWSAAML